MSTALQWLSRIPNRPILWMTTALHFIIGVGLSLDPRVSGVTGLRFLAENQEDLIGLLFLASAAVAFAALWRDAKIGPNAWTFWAFIPQQLLLFVVAAGAIYAVVQGHYASGTVLPRSFIFVDQTPKMLLALLHPLGVLRMHLRILPIEAGMGGTGGTGGAGGAGGASAEGVPGEPGQPGEPGEAGTRGR